MTNLPFASITNSEFRLYFNLYHDVPNKKYVMIKDDGNEEDVI